MDHGALTDSEGVSDDESVEAHVRHVVHLARSGGRRDRSHSDPPQFDVIWNLDPMLECSPLEWPSRTGRFASLTFLDSHRGEVRAFDLISAFGLPLRASTCFFAMIPASFVPSTHDASLAAARWHLCRGAARRKETAPAENCLPQLLLTIVGSLLPSAMQSAERNLQRKVIGRMRIVSSRTTVTG